MILSIYLMLGALAFIFLFASLILPGKFISRIFLSAIAVVLFALLSLASSNVVVTNCATDINQTNSTTIEYPTGNSTITLYKNSSDCMTKSYFYDEMAWIFNAFTWVSVVLTLVSVFLTIFYIFTTKKIEREELL